MSTLVGTGSLLRFILRRDRVRLSLWVFGLVTLMTVSAQSVASLYGTTAEIEAYAATVGDNPALTMFAGPGYGFDHPSAGVILVNETTLWMALGCAVMSVFLVVRHTRVEEDSERADLIRSTVVGRHALMAATVIAAAGANVLVAAGCATATTACGFPPVGSIALCAGVGLVGLVVAAATAVAVQIAATGRGALGLGIGFVLLSFVARGIGDVTVPILSWFTPFGWGIGVRAFAGERWWALGGLAVAVVGCFAAAAALSVRRDLGSGLLRQRPGAEFATPWMCSPLGLNLRLQWASTAAWAIGITVAGLVYGSVADDIDSFIADNPELAEYLIRSGGGSLVDSYLAMALRMVGVVVSGFAIASVLRARSEEAAGFAESLLAAPVRRWWWLGSHLVVTVCSVVALMALSGAALGLTYSASVGDWSNVVELGLDSLTMAPAVLVLAGIATVLFGWIPRGSLVAWAALVVVAVIEVFAEVLDLPHLLRMVSPFELVPAVPVEGWNGLPLVLVVAAAGVLHGLGLVGFCRRDLAIA